MELALSPASGPDDVLFAFAHFKTTMPSEQALESMHKRIDTYLEEDVGRIRGTGTETTTACFFQHTIQAKSLRNSWSQLQMNAGSPLMTLGTPAPFSLTDAIPKVRTNRPTVDVTNGFGKDAYRRANANKLESDNPKAWVTGHKGEGDFYNKGAHVHVKNDDGVDIEVSFKGIMRQDKTLDIQFGIVNTTASKNADEKMKTAAQATVAKRLAKDSEFRDSVIKELKNAIQNVGSRTDEIKGAKILLEILENMK